MCCVISRTATVLESWQKALTWPGSGLPSRLCTFSVEASFKHMRHATDVAKHVPSEIAGVIPRPFLKARAFTNRFSSLLTGETW